uniref:Solute carrier organic anion transporter family member n=1 Tax=Panagrellus redivivus TaxID=6233 RepID=A0A7E4ZU18_PANRE
MALDRMVLAFFVIFMTVHFLESIGGFYMTTAVVSIEKQFQIPSKVSGTMVSAGDFGYIPSVIFVAYLGGKGNRARWIGFGCMLIAVANVLISSSNFVFSDHEPVKTETSLMIDSADLTCQDYQNFERSRKLTEVESIHAAMLCNATLWRAKPSILKSSFAYCDAILNKERNKNTEATCSNNELAHAGPTALIFLGLFILGIGRTMPFSLGLPLIDDNVKKRNLPVYFAGMFLVRMLGPVVGLAMGYLSNKYYYKFEVPTGLTHVDPDWIGRWWAGFLLIGIILFFPSLALFCFPTPKPSKDGTPSPLKLVDKHIKKNSQGQAIVPNSTKSKVTDFVDTIAVIVKQPVYIGCMIGRIMDVFAFKGYFVFLPKYLEVQFGFPQYKIQKYMGIIGITGFALGVSIGTIVMRVFKLEGRRAAGWVALCSGLAALLSFINASTGCESTLTTLGLDLEAKTSLTASCLKNCACERMPMFPVCDQSGEVFYSPCHAGCKLTQSSLEMFTVASDKVSGIIFENCACAGGKSVSRQFCTTEDCDQMGLMYFLVMALGGLVGGMGVTAGMLILLRSVPPNHRSISLGFNGFLVSLFATLPSPIFWGWLFDRNCLKWDEKCPDTRGSCSLYDAANLRVSLHVIYGLIRVISLVTDVFVLYHADGLKLTEEEQSDDDDDTPENDEKTTPEDIKLQPIKHELEPLLEEDANGQTKPINGHRRTPSSASKNRVARAMSEEDEFQRKRSLAAEMLAYELPSNGAP